MRLFDSVAFRHAVREALGPWAIHGLEWVVAHRSWTQTQALGRRLGRIGFHLDRRHRRQAEESIRLAFGDSVSQEWVRATARGCFEHLAMLFLEALRMPAMSREELMSVAEIVGAEHLHAALEQGRGVVLFSGHHGNWEIGAVRLIYEGFPVVPLSRASRGRRLARAITSVRQRLGFPVIPVTEGLKAILRALKNNQVVPIMPDRFARGGGITVPFFGRPTHVWHTPALLAQRAGCPVIPCRCVRLPDGSYRAELAPPAHLQTTADRDRDLWVNTARLMAWLEARLREQPEQYTWPYHLWRPGYEPPSPYPLDSFCDCSPAPPEAYRQAST